MMKLLEMLKAAAEERQDPGTHLGTVSDSLLNEYNQYYLQRENVQDRAEIRKAQLILQIQKQLKEEFQNEMEQVEALHEETWGKIYMELGIEEKDGLTINRATGEVWDGPGGCDCEDCRATLISDDESLH